MSMAITQHAQTQTGGAGRPGTAVRDYQPKPCAHGRLHEHGTRSCYRFDECRCLPCTRANNAYHEQRNRLIAAGAWAPLVDAGPVAAHVQALMQAGLQRSHVAQLAGVAASVITKLLSVRTGSRSSRRVRAETARRLLSVPRPSVDATGTRRRLQALVAIGWPPPALDDQLGEQPGSVERLLQAGQVDHSTAGRVAQLFERLWDSPPPQHTEEERRAANQARARARTNGWGPPMAWDDELNPIDDPAAMPDLGQPVRTSKVPPVDDLLFLIEAGETTHSLARRFGVQPGTIRQALRRAQLATQQDQIDDPAPAGQAGPSDGLAGAAA